ncbi:transcriptional regulator [Clostridium carboxidivorans P7]|uniref:Transcriptional regulator, AsnC family n=1 Tax=Clostridium carboxidivorans P7 TaxID=536227 RepID=C6PQF6_9CLOT|nr:Lrp/AsnC family transcriptional regulator [Clostridium carboxidivorans]AKN30450.1 transcriptional regulator [Clostridium carboxidivorans P7]EET88478.1 transcriptional regulator, AsnC family [Clostridium carboxidivorans P7]EFG86191.1 transcriptional regulator, AsnC family [Clostridium carboxidivorans P7]
MDIIDLKIIDALKENSRSTSSEISRKVNLSIPAVAERIRKLEDGNIIEKYTIKINREKINYKLLAFIFVNIDKTENIENFRKSIVQYNSVLECHHVAGEYDYVLKVLVEDTKSLEYFLSNTLKKIKGVLKSNTIIVLSSLKENINI